MHERWQCLHCETIFVVENPCPTCRPPPDAAICPGCGRKIHRPARMVFYSGLDDD
ncbi:NAD-dependent SIR2 family protein deacetylase [Methanocalculus alkaliphilus]|uniref:hypothetical protein n=1 Tax=Methanocalculus alkaliphilus TaxID=768730 RepID=UPI00209E799F|nr:hypothetical protein [Methanocalculus alkaliphilus]MCP1714787.1 NAD-dependent SIR2 family protein deacetylase [Methanocalculus alkaliphilus]